MPALERFSFEVPVVETERLRLRRHRLEDFSPCAAMWRDPLVTRHVGGKPLTGEEVWARIIRYIGHWAALGFGFWAVEEKQTGRFVGDIGFMHFKREITPSLSEAPEIGWILAAEAHGKGYATEAVRAAVTWIDNHFAASETACIINPENKPSIRVAEKCGYGEPRQAIYKGSRILMFVRPRPQV